MILILSLLSILFFLMFMGVPIAIALGISTTINLIIFTDMDLLFIGQNIYGALDNYALLAIPFFILASNIMAEAGIARRLLAFAETLTAGVTGGLGMAGVMACAIFAAISGSSVATVVSIGTIVIPGMIEEGYDKKFATALISCSGSLGILIPPSILMIIFGVLADVSIGKLFAAGMLPGVILTLMLMAYVHIIARKRNYPRSPSLPFKERMKKIIENASALTIPLLVLGGIYGGVVTPTEAATLAIFLGLFMGFLVYKELKVRKLPRIFLQSAEMSSMILIILAFAYSFAFLLSFFRIPDILTEMMFNAGISSWMFLLLINIILFFAGDFMDPSSIMLIFTPLIVSLGSALGINLIHLGIVVTMNLEIGLITPPVGFNLYVGSSLSQLPLYEVMKASIPMMIIIGIALLLITYVPSLSLIIPKLIFGSA
ncbi:MAG: TRAP transporter large permease subunit [Deltaproteobacteria bacterium]|nr:TRAP transporter large permease subunit [Deltaproteobacteria bacterium]MBW2309262.1 TRAP transporter large permease subunit [Deltaproteobacteria bacterium]